MKVLFVCLGNICRSPLAEGILRRKARAAGLDWEVDSAGANGYHTAKPRTTCPKKSRISTVSTSANNAPANSQPLTFNTLIKFMPWPATLWTICAE